MTQTKASKKRGWIRFVVYLILIVFGFLLGGFIMFARYVDGLNPPDTIGPADGIVVWTGKGGDRLSAAGRLLEQDLSERLLVSGVNKALSDDEVFKLLTISPEKGSCCVDIDYKAEDTIGNARETYNWIASLGYEHVILVTSDYHMPRAVTEIQGLSGRVRITPYPVSNNRPKPWWKDGPQRRRLLNEYGKLLVSLIRNSGQTNRDAPELPELPSDDPY